MSAVSFKCPNCGGDLKFDPATQKYKCEFCISTFGQEELEQSNPQVQQTDEPMQEQADENGAVIYSCPSCGAQIVTDATTAATFCYYCHNPVVLQGKLSGEYEPDMVIPFAVDKKEAVDSFLKYVKKKKFVPKDFFCKEQIEKISGVYFPFWIYNCKADGEWHGQGDKVRVYDRGDVQYTETKIFAVDRTADLTFENMTRNALNKENKELVEAVQPFRLDEAKAFSMGYLSGFLAEKRDIEKSDLADGLKQEVKAHAVNMMKNSASEYSALRSMSEKVHIKADEWKYLMLPVWVLTYKGGDGKTYYYAMNGQTKKISGVFPLAMKRVMGLFFGIFAPVFIFMLLGGYFLW